MKKGQTSNFKMMLLATIVASSLFSCNHKIEEGEIKIIDCLNNQIVFKESPTRVVSLETSLASCYELSGGKFIGVPSNYSDYGLSFNDATIIGTSKVPNVELVASLNPDLIIYSDKLANHVSAAETLSNMGYKTFAAHIDNFDDYLFCLDQLTNLTNRKDLYEVNGLKVKNEIEDIKNKCPQVGPKVMFVRAFSTGYNILSAENIVCDILEDLNTINICTPGTNLTSEISTEIVLKENPEYVFIVTMGTNDIEKTKSFLESSLFSQPYWNKIDAVKNDKVFFLPVDLFHFKPNNKWAESYKYLYNLIYE